MKSPKATITPPPAPPTADTAADNTKDSGVNKRKGFQSTILGGRKAASAENSPTPMKTLLGE